MTNHRGSAQPSEIRVYTDARFAEMGLDGRRMYMNIVQDGNLALLISETAMARIEEVADHVDHEQPLAGLVGLPIRRMS